jgi:hypothetical protein
MATRSKHYLKSILHPYVFVLKEGGKIKKDLFDYSLMILFIHSSEVLKSPEHDDTLSSEKAKESL